MSSFIRNETYNFISRHIAMCPWIDTKSFSLKNIQMPSKLMFYKAFEMVLAL